MWMSIALKAMKEADVRTPVEKGEVGVLEEGPKRDWKAERRSRDCAPVS